MLAEAMVKNSELETIVEALEEQIGFIDVRYLRILLHEILKNHAFQRIMFMLTQETFIDWELKERQLILSEAIQGCRSAAECSICDDSGGLMMHYNSCHHQLHPFCGQDVKNCAICISTPDRVIERILDTAKKVKPEIYSAEIELISEGESRRSLMQKMWEFEELQS